MIYDLSKSVDLKRAETRFKTLAEKESVIELKVKRKGRTVSQNRYLYALFGIYALEYGYTLSEAKTMVKRECEFMRYVKKDVTFLRSTADMDTLDMTKFIEWFRNYSSLNGLYLMSPDEFYENQFEVYRQLEIQK